MHGGLEQSVAVTGFGGAWCLGHGSLWHGAGHAMALAEPH
jgi:hypothetical protein